MTVIKGALVNPRNRTVVEGLGGASKEVHLNREQLLRAQTRDLMAIPQ